MTDLRYRLGKQFDNAVKRFKGDDIVWSVQIMRKMVENAEDYDADGDCCGKSYDCER